MKNRIFNSDKRRSRAKASARSGYLYVAVMMVAVIVSTISLAAITLARHSLRESTNSADIYEAQLLAASALEYAINYTEQHGGWRGDFTSGVEDSEITLNNGTFSVKFVDADGDLDDDDADACWVYGIGRVGDAVQVQKVLLLPTGDPLDCLEVALATQGNIAVPILAQLNGDQTVYSGGDVTVGSFGASLNADVEAVGTVAGNATGQIDEGVSARQFPGEEALTYYANRGTYIDITTLPVNGSGYYYLEKTVLSPGSNPVGTELNPEGIYVIDCQGLKFSIENSRVCGTLVLINNTSSCSISKSMNWEPFLKNYPAILSDGRIDLYTNTTVLSEADLSSNFNPVGTPYEEVEDSDQTDEYPSIIKGIIYSSNTVTMGFFSNPHIQGNLICPTYTQSTSCQIDYASDALDNPPPGFGAGKDMMICPGTWQRASISE